VFRSRNHLPRSPSRLPLRLPGFARTAPSKQQAARKPASTTEFAAEKPGQPARSHRTWPSRTGTAHGRRTPASDTLELFLTGSALAALQTGSVWPASSSPSSQRRGAGSSPNNDTPSCTSRTKVPGRGRGLSWPPSTTGARLAHGARPGLACNREQLLARRPVGLLGKSAGGVGRGSATAAGAGAGAGWSWSWGSFELELGVCAEDSVPPLNFLAWC
jgi:hypothetical protein